MLIQISNESEFHIFITVIIYIIKRKIDHIVYVVSDLEQVTNEFEHKLGVRPIFGGYHKRFGTKNALINLNHKIYLELLAADASNSEIALPRWMGVDFLTKNQITRWALKSNSLKRDSALLKKYNPDMGEIRKGSRKSADGSVIQWKLIMPLASPEVELLPFMLDWSNTEKHPSELLPHMNCELVELYGIHPNPEIFEKIFHELEYPLTIKKGNKIALKTVLKSPNGILEL